MKGLYIHIPFCVKKCEYCDFVSFANKNSRFEAYIDALKREMKRYKGEEINTVFIGGGTPSVLPCELIKELCEAVKENFRISTDAEWTIEVNPGTMSEEKARLMLSCGINRISVGVQSFNDSELKAAGRIHTAAEAEETIVMLENCGFTNISIDLMESLPLQTKESFKQTLKKAVELPVSHISAYSLIIEDGTPIKEKYETGVYSLPDEETDREMYRYTGEFLAECGFYRYEISNYARQGFESRHNIKYWSCDEYIGLGAAAHSYMNGERYSNTECLEDYIKGSEKINSEILSEDDMIGEFMMLGLRRICGVSAAEFEKRFKRKIEDVYGAVLEKFIKTGFMEKKDGYYSLTENGLDVANSIICEFV